MARLVFLLLSLAAAGYFFLFFVSSIREQEKRAIGASAIILSMLAIGTMLILFFADPLFIWIFNAAIILVILALFLPYGQKSETQIVGDKRRYDERDIMFARMHYDKGSAAYEDYYTRFPARQKRDDDIRALPQLMSPGGEVFEPVAATIAENNFILTEKLIPLCDGPRAQKKTNMDPLELTITLKKMARSLGAVDVRTTALDPAHLYSHVGRRTAEYGKPISLSHSHVLVFAVEMDFAAMQQAPRMPVVVESSRQYLEAAKIAIAVASYIRSFGYNARAHTDGNYLLPLPAAAHDAGLGEIGRIGYLIHPKYGARIRLGAVTTDMPLSLDDATLFGVQDFCRICKKCAKHCPAGAISFGDEKEIRGVKKWSTNQEACYSYWRKIGTDCGMCMRVCPYSKPDNFVHDVIRLMIRQNPVARRLAAVGDNMIYD